LKYGFPFPFSFLLLRQGEREKIFSFGKKDKPLKGACPFLSLPAVAVPPLFASRKMRFLFFLFFLAKKKKKEPLA
jgi:hypothetical protein